MNELTIQKVSPDFFKSVEGPTKIKDTFKDIYNKIDILNERLKTLELKLSEVK